MSRLEEFEKEYKELLKKYGIQLTDNSFRDEWGTHKSIMFEGSFTYKPKIIDNDRGYCGMGG